MTNNPEIRKGTEFKTAVPSESGAIVAMCEHKGVILLACQYHIYQLCESDMVFRKLSFEEVLNCGACKGRGYTGTPPVTCHLCKGTGEDHHDV